MMSKTTIELDDNEVQIWEHKLKKVVSLDSFRGACASSSIKTPILPMGTIAWAYEKTGDTITVVAREARMMTVHVIPDLQYDVFVPHQVYIIEGGAKSIKNIKMFLAMDLPASYEAVLYHYPVPNRYSDGSICDTGLFLMERDVPHPIRVDNALQQIEQTRFNSDLVSSAIDQFPGELFDGRKPGHQDPTRFERYRQSIVKWSNWSKQMVESGQDPLMGLKVLSWHEAGTLGSLVGAGNIGRRATR